VDGFEPRDGGQIWVRPDTTWLEPVGLTSVAAAFAHPGEPRGPVKSLVRLATPSGPVFVKRYQFRPLSARLRGLLKLNPPIYSGPRELQNLLDLDSAGFRVPLPLAAGEDQARGLRRSFVALANLAGQPLSELAPPEEPLRRRALLDRIALLARRLHAEGFWHRDLYACNLFWEPALGLGLLDCERVDRRAGGAPQRWRVKDLAALDYSLSWPSERERLYVLRRYLGPEGDLRRWSRLVRRKAKRLRDHGKKGP
jgi:lipopolysaccharide core heptose(I) kinase